ncbi:uncharacterized protein LOC111745562 [Pteropus vampyrus]|uniref:Uncharacterized protein LOC111745562 n=1 Tax=Pteropus vampyrus TaxID=132908 RepID=A0A6P6CXM7_PTEVA|nr:uncharacterized protein LOC111745562 [Pteropus vampyrus]
MAPHYRALFSIKRAGLQGQPQMPRPRVPLGDTGPRNEPGPDLPNPLGVQRRPWSSEERACVLERQRTSATLPPATVAHACGPRPGTAQARREDEAEPRRRKGAFRGGADGDRTCGRGPQGTGPVAEVWPYSLSCAARPRLCILGVQGPQRKGTGVEPWDYSWKGQGHSACFVPGLDWAPLPHPPEAREQDPRGYEEPRSSPKPRGARHLGARRLFPWLRLQPRYHPAAG